MYYLIQSKQIAFLCKLLNSFIPSNTKSHSNVDFALILGKENGAKSNWNYYF